MTATSMLIDPNLTVDDFSYDLPHELIAQSPPIERDQSRLLVVDRASGEIVHSSMQRLPTWLDRGDLLIANNSRVMSARLHARKRDTGGRVELLLLRRRVAGEWLAMAKPARRLRAGTVLVVPALTADEPDLEIEILDRDDDGTVLLAFQNDVQLERYGEVPLPPYIHALLPEPDRYQTVYGTVLGSAAAPTAGLHFSLNLIESLRARGVDWDEVTLHIGLDTFRPVSVARVADHQIHREWCHVSSKTASRIAATRDAGHRVVAVGTTTARTLETLGQREKMSRLAGITTETELFIVPGYQWTMVDALLTNFHLPRSTLLMMVSSFAGRSLIRTAYQNAIRERYRFFSFGDAMLIL